MEKPLHRYSKHQKVLLVEDEAIQRTIHFKILENYFDSIDVANNGKEAIELYKKNKHDIIFTDIIMPVMDGIELIKRVRVFNIEQKIIVISSVEDVKYLLELIDLGISSFINKPIEKEKLEQTLFRTCMNISDSYLQGQYEEKLIDMNLEIKKENKSLKIKISQLENEIEDLKNKQHQEEVIGGEEIESSKEEEEQEENSPINEDDIPPPPIIYINENITSASDLHENYPTDLDLKNQQLESINESLDIVITNFLNDPNIDNIHDVSENFYQYGEIVESITNFALLGYEIKKMGKALENIDDYSEVEKVEEILYSISSNLENWRNRIFVDRDLENINEFDQMLIGDCKQVEVTLNPKSINNGGIELF